MANPYGYRDTPKQSKGDPLSDGTPSTVQKWLASDFAAALGIGISVSIFLILLLGV